MHGRVFSKAGFPSVGVAKGHSQTAAETIPAGAVSSSSAFRGQSRWVVPARSRVRAVAISALVAVATLGAAGQAMAFDGKIFDDKTGVKPQSSPWAVFQFGFSAYKNGHKEQAAEAYK